MAEWWKTAAWPWMKENWWAVLLAPLALIIFILMVASKFATRAPVAEVIDPLVEADKRAEVEENTRTHLLAAENTRLQFALEDIRTKYVTLQERLEHRVQEEVQALRDDPAALRALMLGIGPGTDPKK